MNRYAWIAAGLAILVIGCGGAGGGSSISKTTAGGGSTGTISTTTGGSTSGTTTGGSTSTTGSTTGSSTSSSSSTGGSSTSGGSTGGSSTSGGSTGSSTGGSSTTGGSTDGSTTGTVTGGGTTGSTTGTTTGTTSGSTDGSTTGSTTGSSDDDGGVTVVVTDESDSGSTTTGGSTGSTTGSTSGSTSGGSTGGFSSYSSVVVNIYEVNLINNAGGMVEVFSDPEGTPVDVKALSDNQGAKFQFLNNTVVPYGTYTGVRVVLDENFEAVLASNGQTLSKQFSPSVLDGAGHAVLSYTFGTPITIGSGGATIAIDFDFANWVEQNGSTTPSIGEGSGVDLGDLSRQVTSRSVGFVKNLVTNVSFDLRHGNRYLHVVIGPGTIITGGALSNNKHVFVYAVWNQASKSLIAAKITAKK